MLPGDTDITRRDLLRRAAAGGAIAYLAGKSITAEGQEAAGTREAPADAAVRALEALGPAQWLTLDYDPAQEGRGILCPGHGE